MAPRNTCVAPGWSITDRFTGRMILSSIIYRASNRATFDSVLYSAMTSKPFCNCCRIDLKRRETDVLDVELHCQFAGAPAYPALAANSRNDIRWPSAGVDD